MLGLFKNKEVKIYSQYFSLAPVHYQHTTVSSLGRKANFEVSWAYIKAGRPLSNTTVYLKHKQAIIFNLIKHLNTG